MEIPFKLHELTILSKNFLQKISKLQKFRIILENTQQIDNFLKTSLIEN